MLIAIKGTKKSQYGIVNSDRFSDQFFLGIEINNNGPIFDDKIFPSTIVYKLTFAFFRH